MPIYNFFNVIETKNYSFLSVHWDEYSKPLKETPEMHERWKIIYDEYCKLTKDNKTLFYYELLMDIAYYKTRYEVVLKLINQLVLGDKNKERVDMYIDEINQWKFDMSKDLPLIDEVQKVLRNLKLSKNKIEAKEAELEAMTEKNDEEPISFYSYIAKLERASGRNEINPKKTSVEKFVAIINDTKEINEQKRRHGSKQLQE